MDELLKAFAVAKHVSLAGYSSWRVGGPADYLWMPKTIADISDFLQQAPRFEAITWLGLGSNTLVRDAGLAGLVIITQQGLQGIDVRGERLVYAQAGVACSQLARFCARRDWGGAEFLAGIPGTVGGALRMNAGCFGGEIWDLVQLVDTMDIDGRCYTYSPDDFTVGYREVNLSSDQWFTGGLFRLQASCKVDALGKIKALLAKRQASQPTSDYTCGSVFRNPPNDYAGRLIEQCGLKGFTVGGAMVSSKHANFIINRDQASAQDIERLIQIVQETVWTRFAIALQLEVQVIGA